MALELAFLVLTFFLPGFFLVNLLFPEKGSLGGDLDYLYRAFLAVLMSVSITVIYGSVLVIAVKGSEQVLFRPEYLWPGLGTITLLLFLGGLLRGAYPWLLGRPIPPRDEPSVEGRKGVELFDRLADVSARLEEARRRLKDSEGVQERHDLERLVVELEAEKRRLEEEAKEIW